MGKRVAIEVASILGITVILGLIGLMLVTATDAAEPADLLPMAARFLFGATGIALGLWALLLIIGSIAMRHRSARVRIVVHLLTAVVAIGLNTGLFALVAGPADNGWSGVIIAIALGAGVVLLIAAVIAVLVTELLIVRPRQVGAAAAGEASGAAADEDFATAPSVER